MILIFVKRMIKNLLLVLVIQFARTGENYCDRCCFVVAVAISILLGVSCYYLVNHGTAGWKCALGVTTSLTSC